VRRYGQIAGMVVVLLLILVGALHVMIPWVNPSQAVPDGHATVACWACHIVTSSAQTIDVDKGK